MAIALTRFGWSRDGMRLAPVLAALLWATLAAADDGAPEQPLDPTRAVRISQEAIGRTVGDHVFTDSHGQSLRLASLRGRPVILNLIYTSCSFVCPMLTMRLKEVAGIARATLGSDSFSIVTIGFDTRIDTPERMLQYALERRIDQADWYFASADPATIEALTGETGFEYVPAGGAYDHLAQLTILDGNGRIYRQVYGPDFEPPALVDPLKQLALGTPATGPPLAGLLTKVRLLCTSYDPKSGRYRFDYSLILEILIAVFCTAGIAIFLVRGWQQSGRSSTDPRE
jgi:protein SCO1/2